MSTTRRGFLRGLGLAAAAPCILAAAKLLPKDKQPILGAYWNGQAGAATGISTDTYDNGFVTKTYYYSDYTTRQVRYKPDGELDIFYGITPSHSPERRL